MGWLGFGKSEKSSGSTGKVSSVSLNVHTEKSGKVSDVLVSKGGNPHMNHEHYYDKGRTGWGKSTKGKG